MRIQVISDLHQEFSYSCLLQKKADTLIIAGDLTYVECLESALRTLRNKFSCILFVPGNHEYYYNSISSTNKILNDIHIDGVHILNRDVCQIADIVFIGATGWPNHSYKEVLIADDKFLEKQKNNDWNCIKQFDNDYKSHGDADAHFIRESCLKYKSMKKVIITHFLPLPECRECNRQFDISDAGFINDYSTWCFNNPANIWIHGHSHSFLKKDLGSTLFFRNPFGYLWENKYNYIDSSIKI